MSSGLAGSPTRQPALENPRPQRSIVETLFDVVNCTSQLIIAPTLLLSVSIGFRRDEDPRLPDSLRLPHLV